MVVIVKLNDKNIELNDKEANLMEYISDLQAIKQDDVSISACRLS